MTERVTEAQRRLLSRALEGSGSFRAENSREASVAERLYERGLIGPSIYHGDKWVITPAGRAAISQERG